MRIGLLSDTHLPGAIQGLDDLGPEPANFFSTVDLILHGGDLTSPKILDWLEQFAPVICATGNNTVGDGYILRTADLRCAIVPQDRIVYCNS